MEAAADIRAFVAEQAKKYLPLDRGGSDLHAKNLIVINTAKVIAAEAAKLEAELVNIFHAWSGHPLDALKAEVAKHRKAPVAQ